MTRQAPKRAVLELGTPSTPMRAVQEPEAGRFRRTIRPPDSRPAPAGPRDPAVQVDRIGARRVKLPAPNALRQPTRQNPREAAWVLLRSGRILNSTSGHMGARNIRHQLFIPHDTFNSLTSSLGRRRCRETIAVRKHSGTEEVRSPRERFPRKQPRKSSSWQIMPQWV